MKTSIGIRDTMSGDKRMWIFDVRGLPTAAAAALLSAGSLARVQRIRTSHLLLAI